MLVAAFWLLFTALALFATHGRAIVQENVGGWVYAYRAALIVTVLGYYSTQLRRSGHTLGMRAWRLRAQLPSGRLMSVPRALARCALGALSWGLCALGVLYLYIDRDRLAAHDRLSGTRVVRI